MNVEELLDARDIKSTPRGGDLVVRCLSPEHPDKNPSMRIDRITGIFNCFSCNFKGNIFTHFGEKVNQLQLRRELMKKKIKEKLAESIGLAFPQNAVPYKGNWRNIKPETYEKFEAFQDHDNEYIGRVMFPIRNISGRVCAFIGRHTTGGTPKYLITPHGAKMPLYPTVEPIKGTVILVEGIFDMVNMHDKGLTNTVCCFGTQNINEDKLAILKMQGTEEVVIFFDGDDAGQKAAVNIKAMCENVDLMTKNVCLDGRDPGELDKNMVDKLARKLYA